MVAFLGRRLGAPGTAPTQAGTARPVVSQLLLAWHREGGADWDLAIAERTLTGCFDMMVRRAPPAELAIIAQLGDFLHYDGLLAVTPSSGHVLDADSRFPKVVQAAVRTLRRLVNRALESHARVVVLLAEGNHDLASSVWLRAMFLALYEHEPRVEVIDTPLPFYAYQHGKTMLAWHHGHLVKNQPLPLVMAREFSTMWGATVYRVAHTGHRHHRSVIRDEGGMEVYQHPTLAARDAHSARHGWGAMRRAVACSYHVETGPAGEIFVTPEML